MHQLVVKKNYMLSGKWILIAWWIVLFVLLFNPLQVQAKTNSKPNVLVILVDDLGYGDLSSYGAQDLQSPHIDSLVASGMKFTNGYANCPVCSPTRASLLSGCYPEMVGVPGVIRTFANDNWGYLSPKATLLPTLLKKAGYHTSIIGKWHLGLEPENHPNRRGFDLFHGFLGDMMDDYYTHRRSGFNYMRRNSQTIDPKGHATDLFTQWAIDYIRDRADKDQPWFCYLAYNAPHTPIQPPADWVDKVKKSRPGISDKRAKLVALIEHLDHGIGQVISALKQTGQWNNTLIIFASDNGGLLNVGANNGPLRSGKGNVYEGGIRVPMCAVWPGKIKPDTTTDTIALSMDLFPTICEASQTKINHSIDGVSILPTLLGQKQTLDRPLFWIRREGNNRYMGLTIRAVRKGPWKLVKNLPDSKFELYNLDDDPKEQHNLIKSQPKQLKALAAELRKQIQKGGQVPWQKSTQK